jgi:hypothetical protein
MYANPYIVCARCRLRVRRNLDGVNYPCQHKTYFFSVCHSWGPVDGCACPPRTRARHGTPKPEHWPALVDLIPDHLRSTADEWLW